MGHDLETPPRQNLNFQQAFQSYQKSMLFGRDSNIFDIILVQRNCKIPARIYTAYHIRMLRALDERALFESSGASPDSIIKIVCLMKISYGVH